ncbi:guanine deaminase [Sphaeroforma arctica JP610]|uniref:Guanine deaminase n=1 Tax=Sphaeroforma arctica JP610 TaxID=667725 RepID=A0A0L0G262_9EUKA|nr:guanine deaminase [Sphaeroforma arctica JP610]KNC82283.1 guanine deaminase [Sphaeroforma arctica JP610]|eukprot:XP_014156185.1 guanine deaminase [Sphaeroforma arctica JP610]
MTDTYSYRKDSAFFDEDVSLPVGNQSRLDHVFVGTFVQSVAFSEMVVEKRVVGVCTDGKIAFTGHEDELPELMQTHGLVEADIVRLGENEFIMPGLIDTHHHAPQYAFAGTGYDLTLLDWLNTYTFPVESKYSCEKFAKETYKKAVKRTLDSGTTTNTYFATIHLEASKILVETIGEIGQRAFVGKVNMDRNSPDYYREETGDSLGDTEEFIQHVINGPYSERITPVITPRFVPSCSSELMHGLGELAAKYDIPIQSHLCENKPEIEWVKTLHPESVAYAHVYDDHRLLTDRSIMAHCVHLSDEEIDLFRKNNAGVSHCPNSNFSLTSGCLNVRRLLESDIKVGLGTDVSGGYSSSMLDSMRQAIICSTAVHFQDESRVPLSYQEVFYLATLGGATVLGMDDTLGTFEVGKQFDALRVNPDVEGSPFDLYEGDTVSDIVQKFLYLGDDRNITHVFVSGKTVKSI